MTMVACLLALIACSGPNSDDRPTATPAATESAIGDETPAPTADPATATSAPTATQPAPTATATVTQPEPTATPTATSTPNPTATPQPASGDPLEIDGQPVDKVIQADDLGASLYAISNEQLYRSDDGGETWEEAGEAQAGTMIVTLNDPSSLYAGDRHGCGRGESDAPFVRSSDGGESWETIESSAAMEPLLAYELGQRLVYGTSCGLSVSIDGGESWQDVADLAGQAIFDIATYPEAPLEQLLVVGVSEGGTGNLYLLNSTEPLEPVITSTLAEFWGDAVIDWREGRIAIATSTGVGISDDGGTTFRWSRAGLEDATLEHDPLMEGLPADFDQPIPRFNAIRIVPEIPNLIWLGGNYGAFLSSDGGATWVPIDDELDVESIAISATSGRVYISGEGETRIYTLDGR